MGRGWGVGGRGGEGDFAASVSVEETPAKRIGQELPKKIYYLSWCSHELVRTSFILGEARLKIELQSGPGL